MYILHPYTMHTMELITHYLEKGLYYIQCYCTYEQLKKL